MSKPWDHLRPTDLPPPLRSGTWMTSGVSARVNLRLDGRLAVLAFGNLSSDKHIRDRAQVFTASDLRELAEFCIELAKQLEERL